MPRRTRNRDAHDLTGEGVLFASLVSIAASDVSDDSAMQRCLSAVCEYVGWPVGHIYVTADDDTGVLTPTDNWHLEDPDSFSEFKEITSRTRFAPGEGLPGRVLEQGEPTWIPDVQQDANFPRNKFSKDILVHAAFAVPVEVSGQISAVLEFFTTDVIETDERILRVVKVLGDQIGQILEKQRVLRGLLEIRETAELEVRAELAAEFEIAETLSEIGGMTNRVSITDFYEQFASKVRGLIECDHLVISIVDPETGSASGRYTVGDQLSDSGSEGTSDLRTSPFSKFDASEHPKVLTGKALQEISEEYPDWKDRFDSGYVSALIAVLDWEGERLGHIVLRSRNEEAFGEKEVQRIDRITSQVIGAIVSVELKSQLEQAIQHRVDEETEFIQLLETSPDAIALIDERGVITSVNAAFEKLLDYKHSEIQGECVDVLVPERFSNHEQLHSDYAKSPYPREMGSSGQILYAIHKNGTEIPVHINLNPLNLADGLVIVVSINDISTKLYAEKERNILSELVRIITSNHDINVVFGQFAYKLKEIIDFDRIVISTEDETTETVIDRYVAGDELEGGVIPTVYQYHLRSAAYAAVMDWNGAKALTGSDLKAFSDEFPDWTERLTEGFVSALAVPLVWDEQSVGTIILRSRFEDAFTDSQAELLDQIAAQISGVIASSDLTEKLRLESRERELLSDIGRLLTTPDIGSVYSQLAVMIDELIPNDRIVLIAIDKELDLVIEKFVEGAGAPSVIAGRTYSLSESAAGVMADWADPKNLSVEEQIEFGKRFSDWQDHLDAGFLGVMGSALIWEGQPVGLIVLRAKDADAFGARDLHRLTQVANQIAGAIANADLTGKLQNEVRERDILATVARSVNSDLDMNGVLKRIGDEIKQLIPFDRITYTSLNPETKEFTRVYVKGNPQDLPPVGEKYFYSREGSYGKELYDPETSLWEWGFKLEGNSGDEKDLPLPSWMEVPVGTQGQVPMGFLSLRSYQENAYSKTDHKLLSQISSQIAPGLQNAIAHEEVVALAEERAALADVSRAVSSDLNINSVYNAAADALNEFLAFDRLTISLVTADGSYERAFVQGVELEMEGTDTTTFVTERRPDGSILVGSASESGGNDPFSAVELVSWAEVPLGAINDPIGYLSIRSSVTDAYSDETIELMQRVSAQITPAIRNANLFAESQALSDEREMLARIGVLVTSAATVDAIFPALIKQIETFISIDRIVMTTVDPKDTRFALERYIAGDAPQDPYRVQVDGPQNSMLSNFSVLKPRILQGTELLEWSKGSPDQLARYESGLLSLMIVPLVWQDSPFGLVAVRSRQENAYSTTQLALMVRVVEQIAGAIANTELVARIKEESSHRELLSKIGKLVTSAPVLDEVFPDVAEKIESVVPFDRIVITTVDPKDNRLSIDRFVGGTVSASADQNQPEDAAKPQTPRFYTNQTPTVSAMHEYYVNQTPTLLQGEMLAEWSAKSPDQLERFDSGLVSLMLIPLVWQDDSIGMLTLRSKKDNAYSEYDLSLMARIAEHISGAVANSELLLNLEEEAGIRELISELGRLVSSARTVDEVFPALTEVLHNAVPFDRIVVRVIDKNDDRVTIPRYVGGNTPINIGRVQIADTLTWGLVSDLYSTNSAVMQGAELAEWSKGKDSQIGLFEEGLVSMMVVPLVWQESRIGVINLRSKLDNAYSDAHLSLMNRVAGQIVGAVANTELVLSLETAAFTDPITQLANRAGVETAIDDLLTPNETTAAAIFASELGRVRELEDRFGSAFVGSLMQAIGQRLISSGVPESTVGRVNDNTFIFCRPGREVAISWLDSAETLRALLQEPFEIGGEQFALDVSVGVALYPAHGRDSTDLIRRSVLASRRARIDGAGLAVFKPVLEEEATDHVRTLTNFREGWSRGELELHYQPKVDLITGKIASAEALVRWNSPEQGMVSPGVFIPVVEDSGYMWEFTKWTLAEAIERIHLISEEAAGGHWEAVPIAVNVSATVFQDSRLPGVISGIIDLWNVDPSLVEIEVTETAMMTSPDKAIEVCDALKTLGVSVAIDDFGAGQSPLAYLGSFNVDVIKIDKAFITDIHKKPEARTIVEVMNNLGTKLGKKVVAEGVEIQEESEVLKEIGCHYGQGYLWARPMPSADFQELLRNGLETPS